MIFVADADLLASVSQDNNEECPPASNPPSNTQTLKYLAHIVICTKTIFNWCSTV